MTWQCDECLEASVESVSEPGTTDTVESGTPAVAEEPKPRVALITGITGQDGSYLSELLLSKGYIVHGLIRRSSAFNTSRIEHLYRDPHLNDVKLFLHYGDVTDSSNLCHIIARVRPDEIYNLAAMSHVKVSFEMSEYTADVDALGTLRLLNCIRTCGMEKTTKFYQASTSELYGKVQVTPQSELTPFYPRSPYGVSKQFAFWSVVNYREAYGMYAVNGILFNHESPRRGPTFVTRKITRAVVRIQAGIEECLYIGNLDAKRDWGHAKDYVECMWRMMQQEMPEDFVVATGECHSVREFVELAFERVGIQVVWKGTRGAAEEIGVDANDSNRVLVRVDPKYFRPTEVDLLIGDASKARRLLNWQPSVRFQELVVEMVDADAEALRSTGPDHVHHQY
ncbi:hypothetical protein Poli38472_003876 [Pythium oligandrum]|uniref:GDP-mannose 4,6-dehydratase n=1 Tax=Pythium oligandrum TaxID=41045 RepID=A0A8K1CM11_PYTOL|nr:hypothetical protein Poli38472_003876 [Pythium oligandrum]|eukprot:TMW66111.1 hypothetical protein Poli38472_003876 [Pythium oligandrum]